MLLIPTHLFRELVVVSASQSAGAIRALQLMLLGRYHRPRQNRRAWARAGKTPHKRHRSDTTLPVCSCRQRLTFPRRLASYT